eukprot:gb/GECG01005927.1/.p1 GENE.gb/GECG01005927.1/~~gb/GECG01005927.1/.p1  ORF type:complete len:210 (+),score=24.88 gb/GECG01005927.1/:1-630(+)
MTSRTPNILVVYYSMYGHIRTMARNGIKPGLEAKGANVTLAQVPETLPREVLEKMHAPAKSEDPIADPEDLPKYDGLLFGLPTRYGMMPAQMKAFFDATGGLWQKGALVGKPAGVFFSTGTQGGGQETTALTTLTHFSHHGMIYIPMGYINPLMFDNSEVRGASAYGPGSLAGADGSRQPSENELTLCKDYGSYFATVAGNLKQGSASS